MKKKNTSGRYIFIIFLIIIIGLLAYWNFSSSDKPIKKAVVKTVEHTISAEDLKCTMRKLWEEHIVWTRNLLFCQIDQLPGKEEALERLLQNQIDLGDAMKPYYGEKTGNEFTNLLYPHILISIDVVAAEKSGNVIEKEEASLDWYANANQISVFLCNLNPDWKLSHMKTMMTEHLNLTENEACQRILKNYAADVLAYDELHKKVLLMADMISSGIIEQFPEKF